LAGYSQGGHAALAAADLRAEYAPEVELAGVVGFAAAADVAALFRDGPKYAPYVIHSWSHIYGRQRVDPSEVLQERWASTLEEDAGRMCVEEFQLYYPPDGRQLFSKPFYDALHGGTLERDFPAMAALFGENTSGTQTGNLPVLMVQGGADTIVSVESQDRAVERLRKSGTPVTYLVLDGIPHKHTRAAAFAPAVEWMRQIARGESPLPDNRRL
jgi:pimeloyl-ACP methyl ester carboxylesterase